MATEGLVEIRHAELTDLPALAELKGRVWGRQELSAWTNRWRWQFQSHPMMPADVPSTFLCAVEHARVVGGLGWMPARIATASGEWSSAYTCDAFVDPGIQRGGVGKRLMEAVTNQVPFSLWMNVSPALLLFLRKNGFHEISPLPRWFLPVAPAAIVASRGFAKAAALLRWTSPLGRGRAMRRARAVERPPGSTCSEDLRFGRPFDEFNHAFAPVGVRTVKSSDYLRWRFQECPVGPYRMRAAWRRDRLVGYAVYRSRAERGATIGVIDELAAEPGHPEYLEYLAASAVLDLLDERVAFVTALGADEIVAAALSRLGFFRTRRTPHLFVTPGAVTKFGLTTNGREWNVTLGDCDLDFE